jgi:hypothetical protein
MKIYSVGGAVRDKLLGFDSKDRDWVIVGATEQDILTLESQGYTRVDTDFPVYLHPETKEEYALARRERKNGIGYNGFSWSTENVSLEEDLSRRDLTINAMAICPNTGEIIDPFGGQKDLKDGILRHVSAAFAEDPLRVLRVARFAARYGFSVDPDTMSLMSRMVTMGELDHLTPERVWKELEKLLLENDMIWGLEILDQCGALNRLFGFELLDTDKKLLDKAMLTDAPIESLCTVLFRNCDINKLETIIKFPSSVKETIELYQKYHDFIIVFDRLLSKEKIDILKNIGALRQSLTFKYLMIACAITSSFRDAMIDIEQSIILLKNINYEKLLKNVPNSEKAKVVFNKQLTILENKYVI